MNLSGMIASVGGSPEPVRKALGDGRPPYVLFVVSCASRSQVEDKILPSLGYVPQYGYSEVSDHQDIGICYQEIRTDIERWLSERKIDSGEVYVDITGGTKAMSAALMLAAVERFKNFTYVGGSSRDSNNIGTVLTGSEYLVRCQNPWITYAVRELERANSLLEGFYADSATAILEDAAGKCDESQRARLEAFSGLVKALGMIDRFDFKGACNEFRRWRQKLELSLDYPLYQKLVSLHEHWKSVADQVKHNDQTAGRETLLELVANAERRAKQSRYDDAVGRLYRAVELRGQQLVKGAFGAELGNISIERLPSGSREDVIEKLGPPDNSPYKLGVENLFWILRFCEDETLREKARVYNCLKDHLQKRNSSLLAHGLLSVKRDSFESFWRSAMSALDLCDSDIPRWPQLELRLPLERAPAAPM